MATAAFNPGSPAGMDPWQIESVIAPAAYGGSQAEAQNILNMYQTQREAANNVYGQQVQQQNKFAYDQLQQQMVENYLKSIPEIAKTPGGSQFMASGGLPGLASLGGDPAAWAGYANAGNISDASANIEKVGTGFDRFSEGGLLINPQQLPGMQGVQGQLTDNARVRVEQIKAAAENARAAAASLKPEKTTVSSQIVGNAAGDTHTISTRGNSTDVPTILQTHEGIADQVRQGRAAGGVTGLQPASSSASSSGGGGGGKQIDTNSPIGQRAQGEATRLSNQWSKDPATKAAADDMRAGMRGNTFPTFVMPNGNVVVQGKTGQHVIGKVQ